MAGTPNAPGRRDRPSRRQLAALPTRVFQSCSWVQHGGHVDNVEVASFRRSNAGAWAVRRAQRRSRLTSCAALPPPPRCAGHRAGAPAALHHRGACAAAASSHRSGPRAALAQLTRFCAPACCVPQRTGPAPVSVYFYPHDTGVQARQCVRAGGPSGADAQAPAAFGRAEQRVDDAVVQEATFRGRQLRGITHALPDGYQGAPACSLDARKA